MLILSRDPGIGSPAHAVLDQTGAVWAVSTRDTPLHPHAIVAGVGGGETWDLAVTEGQWWYPGQDADPNRLFRLSFEAGWSLRAIPALRYMLLVPKVWRGSNANKKQLQRQCAKTLSSAERALFKEIPTAAHGDVLDAIMIGRAALKLLGTTQYDWPPVKQPRKPRTTTTATKLTTRTPRK